MWLRVTIISLAGVLLCSCVTTKQGVFAKDWTRVMRENQIEPIFPMRENVQVGDVYELIYDEEDELQKAYNVIGYLKIAHLLFTLPVQKELKRYYNTERFIFPSTKSEENGRLVKAQTADGKCPFDIDTNRNYDRLPHVQFPNISYTDTSKAGIQALVPMGTIPTLLGFSHDKIESVTLRLDGADYYGLPINRILNLLNDFIAEELRKNKYKEKKTDLSVLDNWEEGSTVQVIYEVYQTREIEYIFTTNQNISLSADVFATGNTLQEIAKLINNLNAPTPTNQSTTNSTDTNGSTNTADEKDKAENEHSTDGDTDLTGNDSVNNTLAEHKKSVQQANQLLRLEGDQAGTFSYGGHSSRSLLLKKTFYAPMVVGVRCLNVKRTGEETFEIIGFGGMDFSTSMSFVKRMNLWWKTYFRSSKNTNR